MKDEKLFAIWREYHPIKGPTDLDLRLARAVAQAAREEEREGCAVECVNVAEHYRKKCWDEAWEGAMDCADTIRSREPDAQDGRDGGGCDTFERGAPSGDCEGDGHYECRECRSRAAAGGGKS